MSTSKPSGEIDREEFNRDRRRFFWAPRLQP